ncbi:MAG: CoA transferase [Crocinitomicaceae bacterium]|nr:CoA transferase [Crocinitomicaceae bacterium]
MDNFFKGLTIIELSSVLAGPSVGMFFAELGANVIKIENSKTGGDVTRNWKNSHEIASQSNEISAYFAAVNYGKTHVFLDLKDPKEKYQLDEYVKSADIITTNLKLGDAEKLGLTYDYFRSLKENIIQCQLFGFESDKSRPAFDAVLQAETGYMHMNGHPNSPPTKMPVALIDVIAGHQMKEALLIALLKLEKENLGSYIEVSLEASAISSLANQATNWLMSGLEGKRNGSLHPNIAPYGETYQCKDGKWLVLAIGNDKQFKNLIKILNNKKLEDGKYQSNQNRIANRKALNEVLALSFQGKERDEILKGLLKAKIPAGAIHGMKEVFAGETAQNMLIHEDLNGTNTIRPSSIAFRFSK